MAVKTVKFFSGCMSYTVLTGGRCDIVWNPHAPTEDTGQFIQGITAGIGSVTYVGDLNKQKKRVLVQNVNSPI